MGERAVTEATDTLEALGAAEPSLRTEGSRPYTPSEPATKVAAPRRGRFNLRTFESLSIPSFRWYFLSMLGWFGAMNMQQVVRGYLVFDLTGSYAALGLVALAFAIPGMILALPGGVIADRFPKKQMITWGQAFNVLPSVAVAVLIFLDSLTFTHLMITAFVQGSINAIIMPARQAIISDIVEEKDLMNAVALNAACMNVTRVIGPALGGILVAVVGAGWVYVLMALLFVWSGFSSATMREGSHQVVRKVTNAARASSMSDLLEGARYIIREPVIRTILATDLIIVMLSMPYQFMLPGFADDVLGGGAETLGILLMMVGIGSLIGSLTMASISVKKRGAMLLVSSLIMALAIVGLSIATVLPLSMLAMLGVGLGQAGRMSLATVLLQSYTAQEYRGRVMSVFMIEFSLMMGCTYIVGEVANVIGVQWALGGMAGLLCVYTAYAYLFLPRIRNLA